MRLVLALAAVLALVAGCVQPAATPAESHGNAAVRDEVAGADPQILAWKGHVLASEIDLPSHFQPTEQAIWALQQQGFLLDIKGVPAAMEVALKWSGDAKMMIMLHSHKAHGTNVYNEHITKLDGENPKCLRVPAEDLAEGEWQVMVHTENAHSIDYELTVALVAAEGAVSEKYHGHWPQDGTFEVNDREIAECELLGATGE